MIKKTKKEALEAYKEGLERIKQYNVVTQPQATKLMRCGTDTLDDLVAMGILYSFKIGTYKFFSTSNKKFSNKQIKRSLLLAYSDLSYLSSHYRYFGLVDSGYKLPNELIRKNVIFKGNYEKFNINYYEILDVDNYDYEQLIKLILDIYDWSDTSNIYITLIHSKTNFDEEAFKEAFDNNDKITLIKMANNNIDYQVVNANISHFRYIS